MAVVSMRLAFGERPGSTTYDEQEDEDAEHLVLKPLCGVFAVKELEAD
jgi:hypothetical protein